MSTADDHPITDPVAEVWAGMLTRYISAMGMVVLHYDCLLTINDEVKHNLLASPCICPTVYCRLALFGQEPSPSQNSCITLIDIYLPL